VKSVRRLLSTPASHILAALALLAGIGDAFAAGGAFNVDDSEIGSPGECKTETWTAFAANRDFIGVAAPACVVEFSRPVEIGAQLVRFRSGDQWGTDLILKGKTSLIPLGEGKIGVGFIGGGAYSFTQHEMAAAFATLPVSFQISDTLRLNVNAGVLRNLIETRTLFTWGAGADLSLSPKVTLIAEVFGFNSETSAQAGMRYTPHEKIDFDLTYGRNLTGERADWITLGINLRF
jgi:hypothetical protein